MRPVVWQRVQDGCQKGNLFYSVSRSNYVDRIFFWGRNVCLSDKYYVEDATMVRLCVYMNGSRHM